MAPKYRLLSHMTRPREGPQASPAPSEPMWDCVPQHTRSVWLMCSQVLTLSPSTRLTFQAGRGAEGWKANGQPAPHDPRVPQGSISLARTCPMAHLMQGANLPFLPNTRSLLSALSLMLCPAWPHPPHWACLPHLAPSTPPGLRPSEPLQAPRRAAEGAQGGDVVSTLVEGVLGPWGRTVRRIASTTLVVQQGLSDGGSQAGPAVGGVPGASQVTAWYRRPPSAMVMCPAWGSRGLKSQPCLSDI